MMVSRHHADIRRKPTTERKSSGKNGRLQCTIHIILQSSLCIALVKKSKEETSSPFIMLKLNLWIMAVLVAIGCASAFSPIGPMQRSVTTAPLRMAASTEESTLALQDSKGEDVKVGSLVKVVVEGLKAFQVSRKGQGSFVDGVFVPAPEGDLERAQKNLKLPVGMVGVVTKLYNTDEVSSNLPIQAKFKPDTHNEESGLNPPVAFLMHFESKEIEIV
jgi:hypothetical protein